MWKKYDGCSKSTFKTKRSCQMTIELTNLTGYYILQSLILVHRRLTGFTMKYLYGSRHVQVIYGLIIFVLSLFCSQNGFHTSLRASFLIYLYRWMKKTNVCLTCLLIHLLQCKNRLEINVVLCLNQQICDWLHALVSLQSGHHWISTVPV